MAESSKTSVKKEKPSITPEEALEILQEAIVKCQQLGISISLAPFFDNGQQLTVIVMAGVSLVDGNLVLV